VSASPKVNSQQIVELARLLDVIGGAGSGPIADIIVASLRELNGTGESQPKAEKPKAEKPSQNQRSTARKPKATLGAPDGFEVGSQFIYVKADGAESTWTVKGTEGVNILATRMGTTKARPWKLTSIAAMLQSGNIRLDSAKQSRGHGSKPGGKRRNERKKAA